MALASLGRLAGSESTVLSPLRSVDAWGKRESDLLGAMTVYFMKSAINAKIPVDQSTVEALFQSANQGDERTMKSVLAEIGEEIAKNERKKAVDEGIEIGVENGLRIAIDNVTSSRFHKRSRRLNADVKRVSDFEQLNSILTFATVQATSINDVIAYVGALQ